MADDDISRGVRQAELDLEIRIDRLHQPEDEWLPLGNRVWCQCLWGSSQLIEPAGRSRSSTTCEVWENGKMEIGEDETFRTVSLLQCVAGTPDREYQGGLKN